ncbi:MAG: calcium-binding protein [Pseudoxanthomonas sp.]
MADEPKDPKPLRKIGYPFPKMDASDPAKPKQVEVKDAQDYFKALAQAQDGFYPIGYNGQWHGGIHFGSETGTALAQNSGIRCIADGEMIAYRIDDDYPTVEYATCSAATYSRGFVLVRHRLQLPPAPKTSQSDQASTPGTSGTTAHTQAEPSLVFYSLYMHLRNWKAYEADAKLKRPAFWDGGKEYLVGEKAKDKEETLAPGQTGLRVRDGNHKPISILPRGTRLTLGAAVTGRNGFHEITSITSGDSVPAGQHSGRTYLPELDALTTPSAKGAVVVLAKPAEIKAGDLIGHLGQYQRYSDMNPMATTCTDRPLVQLDVFTGEDLQAFITQSRARDAQLDAKQKTLLHIKPGARFVQPTAADVDLPVGEAAIPTGGGNASDRWAKGRRGTVQTVEKTTLGNITMATRTYPNGNVFISAVRPSDGNELTLEQFNALAKDDQNTYSQRKVLVPAAGDVWLDMNAANASGTVQGPTRVWSSFPLKITNASGDAVEHSRVVTIKSAEAITKEANGTRWFLAEAGGGATGSLRGWVREKDHPNVVLCSPWAWPGFVLMDTGTLQPKDLYGRALTQTRQAQASERGQMEALSQSAEQSPLFDALCKAIDADGKDGITPLELRSALGKPWLAQALSRLAIKHHSEWAGPMDRWNAIDELIPEPRKADWEKEKSRIKELQFWDGVKGKSGFPSEPKVHHLHPVGFVENFRADRGLVTVEMLREIFSSAPENRLQIVADGVNINIDDGKLNSEERLCHFFGQVRQEIGESMAFREDLRYSSDGLFNSKLSYYRGNRERSDRDARNEEAIANNAYDDANRPAGYKLGNTEAGDGWRYRGRGLKQLTGRSNYRNFTTTHQRIWGDAIDFEANPDMVDEPTYAVRSALAFWVDKKLYEYADAGITKAAADNITRIINSGTDSYTQRWNFVQSIWQRRIFKDVF